MKIRIVGGTDQGKHRKSNEDAYGIFEDLNLAVVADGMGGHAAGEVASRLAVESVYQTILQNPPGEPTQLLNQAILNANARILETAKKDPALTGMGTTIVVLLISGETAHIGYAGDSRVYLFRKSTLKQLTEDHSLVGDYIRKGLLTPEEAQKNPLKHVITRALGTSEPLKVDQVSLPLEEDDIFLLCSDGLSNMVNDEDLQGEISSGDQNLETSCSGLIQLANKNGGADNITLVLLQCQKNSS
ncbi:MAG TPA: Stp1/IreP family PP2C-type Ser/Thr phosphatase [Nitrospiria bacterium]|jgi:protein phosphatase